MTDSALKTQLHTDLTAAMKSRDQLRSGTLRMALTAITNEEVSGKTAKELTDADVITVLTKEAKRVAKPQPRTTMPAAPTSPTRSAPNWRCSMAISGPARG